MQDQLLIPGEESVDGGPKRFAERTCIVSRRVKPVSELLRFVRAPDGALIPDLRTNLPGRGVWVSADAASVAEAVRRGAFRQALKSDVKGEEFLVGEISALLLRRAREALALANKAGDIIYGFAKVEAALELKPLALIHAVDAGFDGVDKLNRRYRAICGTKATIFTSFTGEELDMVFGRPNVVHAAVREGDAGRAFFERMKKAAAFAGGCAEKLG